MGFQIKRGWLAIACFGFLCLTLAYWYSQSAEYPLKTPAATAMGIASSPVRATAQNRHKAKVLKQGQAEQNSVTVATEKPLPDTIPSLKDAATTAPKQVAEFYAQRQWQPLWDKPRLLALLTEIRALKADGLDPDDYSLGELENCQDSQQACARSAERELLATRVYLLALKHLYLGRVNPTALDPHWNFDIPTFDPEHGMQLAREAVEKNQLEAVFQRARPTLPRYEHMRKALTRLYQQAEQGGWPLLPETLDQASLKPGMTDDRVALLRQRMKAAGLLNPAIDQQPDKISPAVDTTTTSENPLESPVTTPGPDYYDSTLENAVRRFQQASFLVADGVVGKQTLQALNVPITERIGQLRVNLERMRWPMREISGDYVTVDVAGYNIAYIRDGKAIWTSRVQVGKRYRKTPIFQSTINRITLNPQWTVPPTIMYKDMLPEIRKNRSYLTKHHIRVFNKQGRELSPKAINWNDPGPIILRQDAGPEGALGQIAIRFPNDYTVYLHETPNQKLFEASQRNFSSGCIRVENVRELAVLLLNDEENWNREALELALTDIKTREMNLAKKVPILIDYWTVDVSEEGYLSYRPDVYGKDKDVLAALDTHAP